MPARVRSKLSEGPADQGARTDTKPPGLRAWSSRALHRSERPSLPPRHKNLPFTRSIAFAQEGMIHRDSVAKQTFEFFSITLGNRLDDALRCPRRS